MTPHSSASNELPSASHEPAISIYSSAANSTMRDFPSPKTKTLSEKLVITGRRLAAIVGPAYMVAVGYFDPGNWATDLSGGSEFEYKLLFIIALSNFFAIYLQRLTLKLGIVSGKDLAESCRAFCSPSVNIVLYILGEIAIMATDLAEVIGSAIALKLLFNIPLPVGVLITTLDVFVILFGYQPNNPRITRMFEFFIFFLVSSVAGCFIYLLALSKVDPLHVARGFLPTFDYFTSNNPDLLVIAMGIIGATVMPHNLYLHSHSVKVRAASIIATGKGRDIIGDKESSPSPSIISLASNESTSPLSQAMIPYSILVPPHAEEQSNTEIGELSSHSTLANAAPRVNGKATYNGMQVLIRYSFIDLTIALLVALFVNAAILIVAGSNMYDPNNPSSVGELSDAFQLMRTKLGPAASGTFAFALLLAGQSSTITGTLAGQVLMEGFLQITIRPWLRRIITRGIAIIPAMVVAISNGDKGLNRLLIISQVVLSVQLPFAVIPLLLFTSSKRIMGTFKNSVCSIILGCLVSASLIILNIWMLVGSIKDLASE